MDLIHDKFVRFVKTEQLLPADHIVVLAVSGGVDSVVLAELCYVTGTRFVIAHMNFALRAAESKRDQEFVESLAAKLGVACHVKEVDTAAYASERHLSIQEAARELRYAWFEELRSSLAQVTPARIATAHHLDDSVETMLMNMFRGTGITGLRGILPRQQHLVRPMLCLTKDEIVAYANSHKLQWVTDSSNQLDKYTRNYFRNQLIPMIRTVFPHADQNLYSNLHRFQDAVMLYRESVERRLKKLVEFRGGEVHVPIRKLRMQPAWETILFELLQQYGFVSKQLSQVVNLLDSETGKQVVSDSHRAIKNRQWLIIASLVQEDAAYVPVEEIDTVVEYHGGRLVIANLENAFTFTDGKPGLSGGAQLSIALIESKQLRFPLLLRKAKPGDYFYPLGMRKKKKIARFLIDLKLSKTAKESVWVLESDKKIVWVVGYRIDDRFRISENTKNITQITYTAVNSTRR
ncbi:MAG: tRNA lysidine(34) synthetase TilS [Chitinophagaceae bacterium]|nr:MAG: tRNA lysidine(34) synthetase TilS [Chitinophagaceae bacterium]